jgi:dienelactone hydrolase
LRGISRHTGTALHGVRGEDRALDNIETARWVQKQPWHAGKIALVGFSQGGAGVLSMIDERIMRNLEYISDSEPNPISVAVAFYPACTISSVPSKPAMPTQIHLAEKDDLAFISACHFHTDHTYEVHTYKNATHSFDEYIAAGAVLKFTHRYDSQVTSESRKNLRRFLDEKMK